MEQDHCPQSERGWVTNCLRLRQRPPGAPVRAAASNCYTIDSKWRFTIKRWSPFTRC